MRPSGRAVLALKAARRHFVSPAASLGGSIAALVVDSIEGVFSLGVSCKAFSLRTPWLYSPKWSKRESVFACALASPEQMCTSGRHVRRETKEVVGRATGVVTCVCWLSVGARGTLKERRTKCVLV